MDPEWSALVAGLGLTGAVRLLASNCAYLRRDGNTLMLGLDPRSESMLTKSRRDQLAAHLSEHFGETLTVDIDIVASPAAETPMQQETRLADERLEQARRSLEEDPNVQTLKNMFGAEMQADSVEIIAGEKG